MNKSNLLLSIAAGVLGGAVSMFFAQPTAHAQAQVPEEIRAQRFSLVDQQGKTFGSFSFDESGRPQIVLRDRAGHDVWRFVGEHVSGQRSASGQFQPK